VRGALGAAGATAAAAAQARAVLSFAHGAPGRRRGYCSQRQRSYSDRHPSCAVFWPPRNQQGHRENTLGEQGKHLDRTLAEQREQLDRTLAEQRTRTLNERFATAAEQLGSDKSAVRLAGVYAMAGLADDWEENRQTCADVLCAYLRMPYEPDPGQDAPEPQRLAFQAIREVRHTVSGSSPRTSKKTLRCPGKAWTSTSQA
jgi:hypothetical protein